MEAITKTVADPAWWFTAVAVGLLVNLMAAGVVWALPRSTRWAWAWWQRRSATARAAREERVAWLLRDPSNLTYAFLSANWIMAVALLILILVGAIAGALLLAPHTGTTKGIVLRFSAAVGLFTAMRLLLRSFQERNLVAEARFLADALAARRDEAAAAEREIRERGPRDVT